MACSRFDLPWELRHCDEPPFLPRASQSPCWAPVTVRHRRAKANEILAAQDSRRRRPAKRSAPSKPDKHARPECRCHTSRRLQEPCLSGRIASKMDSSRILAPSWRMYPEQPPVNVLLARRVVSHSQAPQVRCLIHICFRWLAPSCTVAPTSPGWVAH